MENKLTITLAIIAIVLGLVSIGIWIHEVVQDRPEESNPFETGQGELPACYMPRDCFETEKEYLDQFPGREVPEILYECLVYCYN